MLKRLEKRGLIAHRTDVSAADLARIRALIEARERELADGDA